MNDAPKAIIVYLHNLATEEGEKVFPKKMERLFKLIEKVNFARKACCTKKAAHNEANAAYTRHQNQVNQSWDFQDKHQTIKALGSKKRSAKNELNIAQQKLRVAITSRKTASEDALADHKRVQEKCGSNEASATIEQFLVQT